MRYVITYDLRVQGQAYTQLLNALREIGAVRVLQSVWFVVRDQTNAAGLRDYLRSFIDNNDRILVVALQDWGGYNLMADIT